MTKSSDKIKKQYTTGIPGNVNEADYFYYDTAPSEFRKLAIVCGGYEKCAPDFDINRNNYPYYFIKLTLKGKGALDINGQTLSLKPGVLTGFEPGTPHHYITDPSDPMEHIFVTFIGCEAGELFQKSTLGQRHYIEASNPQDMMAICQKILNLGLHKPALSQEICCSYLRVLLLEQAASLSNPTTSISISMSTYQKCRRYIDLNFSVIQSPSEVAEKCGIDVRYMASLFKKYGHISPCHYIMRLKLNKAANLLLTTNFKIKKIATLVGIYDPYHFSKSFKRLYSLAPRFYRKNHFEKALLDNSSKN